MATNPIPFPTLSNQFCEFRRPNRSMEPRKVVVQGTQNSVAASYLSTANDTRATYFARGDYTVIPVTASPLPVKTSLDYVDSTAVVAVALPDPSVVNDTLVNGIVKTIFTDGTNVVTVTPGTGDIAVIPAVVGANVTYMWDSTRWTIIGQGSAAVAPLTMPDGTAAAPGLAFTLDPDTGIYRPAANEFGVSTGGVAALQIDFNQNVIANNGVFRTTAGGAAAPGYAFTADVNTGLYLSGVDEISVATGGVQGLFVDATQDVYAPSGDIACWRPTGFQSNVISRGADNLTARRMALQTGAAGNGWDLYMPVGGDYLILDNNGTSADTDFHMDVGDGSVVAWNSVVEVRNATAGMLDADYVATAQEMLNGYFLSAAALGANRLLTTATAAAVVAAIPAATVGTTFDVVLNNTQGGAFTRTMTAGVGFTVQGAGAVNQNDIGLFRVVIEDVGGGTETATIVRMD